MKVNILVLFLLNASFLFAQYREERLVDSLIANSAYPEAAAIIQQKINTTHQNIWLNKQAELFMAEGKMDEAESQLNKIVPGNDFEKAITNNNLGWLSLRKGRSDKALDFLQAARDGFTESGNSKTKEAARCLSNLTILYWSIGKMNQAEENGVQALHLRENIFGEESEEVAASLNDIGLVYSSTDPDKALENYEKALAVYERIHGNDHPKIAIAKTNIGLTYKALELYGDAVNNFEDALAIWRKKYPSGHPNEALTLANLGSTYKSMKNPATALEYYDKALAIFKKNYGDKHPDLAAVYNQIGVLKMDDAQFAEALQNFQEALCANVPDFDSKDIDQNPKITSYYRGMLLLYSLESKARAWEGLHYSKTLKLQNLKQALSILYSCDSLVDLIRHQSSDVNDKILLSASAQDVYEDGVRIAQTISEMTINSRHYRETAFYFAEKSKSATLLESIADTQAKSFAGIPATLLEDEKNKKALITLYTEKLTQKPTIEEERKLREQLYRANLEYNQFIGKLEKEYPDYFNLKYNSSIATVSELQKRLLPGQSVLSLFADERNKRLYQFIVTTNKFRIETRSIPDGFDRLLKGFTNSLLFNSFDTYQKSAGVLTGLLFPKFPSAVKEIVIIPFGKLGTVPFESLPLKILKATQFKDVHYLINRFAISYEFSAGLLLQKSKTKTETNESIFLCAPVQFSAQENLTNLPGTEHEVSAIATLFPAPKVVKFAEASERTVKSGDLNKYNFLHFATHGVVDAVDPELSRIFLTAGEGEDGNLYSGEIYNLRMNANLVVLSACETGLGKVASSEGVIGLSRALTYAGAKNLIVSFWAVADESTSELMVDFYKHRKAPGLSGFSDSLRQAKLDMIQGATFSSPYYWAPFVLIGR